MTFAVFHDFPGPENGPQKFHDFPGPPGTLFHTFRKDYVWLTKSKMRILLEWMPFLTPRQNTMKYYRDEITEKSRTLTHQRSTAATGDQFDSISRNADAKYSL